MNLYTTPEAASQHYLAEEVYPIRRWSTDSLVDHHYRGAHEPGNRAALAAYLSGYLNHRIGPALLAPRQRRRSWSGAARRRIRRSSRPTSGCSALPNAELEVLEGAGDAAARRGARRPSRERLGRCSPRQLPAG